MIVVKIVCRCCKKEYFFEVKAEDYVRYMEGAFIQDAFPYLPPEDRELFHDYGMCKECWNKYIGPEP